MVHVLVPVLMLLHDLDQCLLVISGLPLHLLGSTLVFAVVRTLFPACV